MILTFLFIKNAPSVLPTGTNRQQSAPKEIYKNRKVINVGLIYGIVGLTYIVQTIFIMSYMIESGVDIKIAGQLMALNGILSIFSGPIWGAISDKLGRRISLNMTMGLSAISMLLPVFFPTVIGFFSSICLAFGLILTLKVKNLKQHKPSMTEINAEGIN